VKEDAMRVVVIGATGHIGTYLVPRLLAAGHQVVALSRGQREPYQGGAGWGAVRGALAWLIDAGRVEAPR
jgi:uncharacterized protein YbjT (DUF2867 family)